MEILSPQTSEVRLMRESSLRYIFFKKSNPDHEQCISDPLGRRVVAWRPPLPSVLRIKKDFGLFFPFAAVCVVHMFKCGCV